MMKGSIETMNVESFRAVRRNNAQNHNALLQAPELWRTVVTRSLSCNATIFRSCH